LLSHQPAYQYKVRNIVVNAVNVGASGFISHKDKTVYINTEPAKSLGFLIRTAKDTKDYAGGVNKFYKELEDFTAAIEKMLESSSQPAQ
jgi:hypothetical protein